MDRMAREVISLTKSMLLALHPMGSVRKRRSRSVDNMTLADSSERNTKRRLLHENRAKFPFVRVCHADVNMLINQSTTVTLRVKEITKTQEGR